MWDTYIFGHLGIPHILCSSQLNPVKMDTFSAQFSPWDLLKISEYSSTLVHHLQIASASSSCLCSGLSDRGQSWPLPQRLPGGPRMVRTKCWSGQRSCPCLPSRSKQASPEIIPLNSFSPSNHQRKEYLHCKAWDVGMPPDGPRHSPGARSPGWCWTRSLDQRVTCHQWSRWHQQRLSLKDFKIKSDLWLMEHNDLCDSKWLDIVDKGMRERSAVSGSGGMSQTSYVLTRVLCNTSHRTLSQICPAGEEGRETPPLLNIILDNDNLNRNLPQHPPPKWFFIVTFDNHQPNNL